MRNMDGSVQRVTAALSLIWKRRNQKMESVAPKQKSPFFCHPKSPLNTRLQTVDNAVQNQLFTLELIQEMRMDALK